MAISLRGIAPESSLRARPYGLRDGPYGRLSEWGDETETETLEKEPTGILPQNAKREFYRSKVKSPKSTLPFLLGRLLRKPAAAL